MSPCAHHEDGLAPAIPDADALPKDAGLDLTPYKTEPDTNPNPAWAANPNIPLQQAVELIKPTSYLMWHIQTMEQDGRTGQLANIPFE